MAHKEQKQFCKQVRNLFPQQFRGVKVVDVGSLDINGNNRYLFKRTKYTGIDIVNGRNVDIIGKAHEVLSMFTNVDTIISTECLEHDKYWKETLLAMYYSLAPEGLMVITCGGEGRQEHGTTRHHGWCSPATNDYYMNITNEMFASVLSPDMFEVYHLGQQRKSHDLQFYGKRKSFTAREIYSKLLNKTA